MKREAMYYEVLKDGVKCLLCPHFCVLKNGNRGLCSVRYEQNHVLYTENYGEVASLCLDPIEKKPLSFFHPGSQILSVGTYGCNFRCKFCQNYGISQFHPQTQFLSPEELVSLVGREASSIGIAFTYNEPFIWYEYLWDVILLLKKAYPLKKVILITDGFVNPKPLSQLLPYVDAMNIDLKSFSDEFYKRICNGALSPVLETIQTCYSQTHVEITTLVIPNHNDSLKEIKKIAEFLCQLDKEIPLHLSRYFPRYQMEEEATPVTTLFRAEEVAKKYLSHVVLGNL